MSAVITLQAVPGVACGDWDVINQHLLDPKGDWRQLRSVLIHLVCSRLDFDGDPVSRIEEVLINRFYINPPFRVGFADVLRLVRSELEQWPEQVLVLAEHALLHQSNNPDLRFGLEAFPVSLDTLRRVAPRASTPPPAPKRSMSNVYRDGCLASTGERSEVSR